MLKKLFNKKYRFFSGKVFDVTRSIWEYEFKIAKTLQVREGIRQDRDRAIEAIIQIDARLKGSKDKKEKDVLTKELDGMKENVRRYEAQMTMLDNQVNGVKAEGNNPGEQGLNDTIASLAELREMYKSYLKQC